ncbi:MAG: TonB-dependent receptor plug domain-containing protein, partial [Gammaproteobacteria bacterium]|nr:TonB-dependent receptor plug domain-containing protein [Gammaproteobacteria bacterium]
MRSNYLTRRAVHLTLAAAAAAVVYAPQVMAQEGMSEVVVTGTRITTPGLTSNSPINSVGREEIALSQPVAIEEFFRNLPSAYPAIGPGTNNGSGGGATIDLRGLGPQRTLVLVDGRRLVPFDLSGRVDTNSVPVALIERVDLVTGGASAVYGADAITGVVNFVLRRDFEGVDISSSYGVSGESDAKKKRIDFTMGGNFADGRGNAVLSIGYTDVDEVRQDARSIGLAAISSTS